MSDNEHNWFYTRISVGLIGSTIAISAIAVTALTGRRAVPLCISGGALILNRWGRAVRASTPGLRSLHVP